MPEPTAFGFGEYVPGFDFLQTLAASAAKGMPRATPAGLPDWSAWVAPTLRLEELDKRIQELKTVQFWLEQNARALAATIQALEVQKMSLATLRSMNVQMGDLASAFGFPAAEACAQASAPPAAPAPAARAAGAPGPYDDMFTAGAAAVAPKPAPVPDEPSPAPAASAPQADAAAPSAAPQAATAGPGPAGVVDPLQWWNALTDQFQQIAAAALQDATRAPPVMVDAATRMASAAAVPAGAVPTARKTPSAPGRAKSPVTPRTPTPRVPKAPSPSPRAAAPAPRPVAGPHAPAASSAAPRITRRASPPAAAPAVSRPTRKR
ncbi:PhaM family polyhydroxyalkanoate granule multifunctional regulatory protein [Xylophilus ampelinus]|uniref:Uncharacterized protein n=1 Tax=Xylophilus ampelinus TaxID=54067 RepID=A0A318SK61_9BURK|nr:PhaM family polyhydroxyalkanoate granule multifunctional regulatory protein [Xylophilus ampelinus]MCS4511395.1 hypothetical protein [Xylophilus ampelinus]PYE75862.1 hypothetical protein DFQ15_11950 [Xylophilus ampelinus]